MDNMQNFDGSIVKLNFNQTPELINDDSIVFATDAKAFSTIVNSFSMYRYDRVIRQSGIKNCINVKVSADNSNINVFATNTYTMSSIVLPAYAKNDFDLRFTDAKNIALLLKSALSGLKKDENPLFILRKQNGNYSIQIGNAIFNYGFIFESIAFSADVLASAHPYFIEKETTLSIEQLEQVLQVAKKSGKKAITFYKRCKERLPIGFEMKSNREDNESISGLISPYVL